MIGLCFAKILKPTLKTALVSKAISHKPYRNLQLLLVLTCRWKNLSIDFMTGVLILTNWKVESYNSIFLIID